MIRRDIANDGGLTEQEKAAFAAVRLASMADVPLVKAGRLVAIFFVHHREAHAWTEGDVALMEAVAERTWASVAGARAEAALRESEEKFRTLFESMDEGFAECELVRDEQGRPSDFRYLNMNPAFEKQTGQTRESALGRLSGEVVPVFGQWWLERFTDVVDAHEPVRVEHRAEPLDRWYEMSVFPRSGDRFAFLCNDITERKRAEESLRASEARFSFVLNAAQLGAWDLDLTNHTAWRSPTHDHVFGYPELLPEWTYEMFLDHVLPSDRVDVDRKFREAVANGTDWQFECRIRRPDGETRWIWAQGRCHRNEQGKPERMSGVMQDVTARKNAEQAVRDREEQFRRHLTRLMESNIVGVALANEKTVLDANDLFLQMTGYTRQDLAAGCVDWAKATPAELLYRDVAAVQELRTRGVCAPFEKEYLRPDGTRVPVLIGAAAIPDSPELTWIAFVVDLSEQKTLERQLRFTNGQLVRANQDLEQFAYSASHDLQEPLRNVAVFSQLMKKRYDGRLDEQADTFLRYIVDGAHRMGHLVSDLLTYTRAAAAEDSPEGLIDTDAVLEPVLKGLGHTIEETHAIITHDRLPFVCVREMHLEQLFQNLISNALKYRRDSEPPRVHVTAEPEGEMWRFSISDNGIGIAPEYHWKVFGIFKRLHSGTQKYSGTGIGLAICQRIVERYGGRIWVESELGLGSTFHFTLPGGAA